MIQRTGQLRQLPRKGPAFHGSMDDDVGDRFASSKPVRDNKGEFTGFKPGIIDGSGRDFSHAHWRTLLVFYAADN
ncbi:hypothetical protein HRG_004532 [Hirsutella rhossiliensis]